LTLIDHLINRESPVVGEPQAAFMIVGLGNPGREYRETRHNIGFMVVDTFAAKHEIKLSKVQNKAIVGIGKIGETKVILVKPQTYMNLSGQAVSALVRFYKIPLGNLVVAHDDVDLPFGVIRMRPGGGSAGQKGINSIIERVGSQDFPRLRMGVGRPPGQMDAAAYVLDTAMNRFNPNQSNKE
jgi:PTH1 family peptidyl-tRNA hydrolase